MLLIFAGIPAIILGHKSLRAAAREGHPAPGLAITGLILGYLTLAVS
ncbi:MAG: DUF4190 domain-containing protein, partial [Akkermansiaceae bacterium]|nr:DUF4190 domain-containing protein [Akkermansiaceae bacterium]